MAGASRSRSRSAKRPTKKAAAPVPQRTIAWQQAFSLKTDEAERALRTGEHAALLEDYFGPEQYDELRRLAQEASTSRVRGGPRVLILPGILGSTIGVERWGPFDDVYWLDPLDIAKGYLSELALPTSVAKRFTALGVILFTYLRLKLALQLAGYDADFVPYDWRKSIAEAGQALLDRIVKERAADVSLVAHSMGGLVARFALAKATPAVRDRVRRLIMLGTPNQGSFAPVQAIRGTYGTVTKLARLDQKHSADWLAANVFNTFPGLYEMLPTRSAFGALDLYDSKIWPGDKSGPRQPILDAVPAVQKVFSPADPRMVLIAGINKSTTVDVKADGSTFVYGLSNAGDGTVPLAFAQLDGVKTYYVEEEHGSLPNNSRVERAVRDILGRGETSELPSEWAAPERSAVKWVPEDELLTGPFREAEPAPLSQRDIRNLISEYAAAESTEIAPRPLGPPDAATTVSAAGYEHAFDRIVVARQRAQRIDIRFALGSITEVDARAYVLGVFEDVTPGGAAVAIDQRMKGAITDAIARRMFSGRVGEMFVMPSGRDGLRADMVAFVGLGPFDRFNQEVQQVAAENVIRMFARTHVEEFATVLFGAGSGGGVAATLRNLMTGFLRGLADADRDRDFRRLILCERDPAAYQEMKEELFRLSSTDLCRDVEFTFDEVALPAPEEPVRGGIVPVATAQPVYLLVRQEPSPLKKNATSIHASVLTAGGKAAVISESMDFDDARWKAIKDSLAAEFTSTQLPGLGDALCQLMIPTGLQQVLKSEPDRHLVVVHDADASRVPWEIVKIGDSFPAANGGMSHRYVAENLSVAKWLQERRTEKTLRMLLIISAYPGGGVPGLDGAMDEYRRVKALAAKVAGIEIEEYVNEAATKPAVLAALRSGRYDVVHYAGHAFFEERDPKSSGIVCHGATILSGADLAGVGNLPALMFFNACEAARIRSAKKKVSAVDRAGQVRTSAGLAEAFLRGGVANFVGTYWSVGDAAAETFASVFYQALFDRESIGAAVKKARLAVKGLPDTRSQRDWADYVHYGNPDFVLKVEG